MVATNPVSTESKKKVEGVRGILDEQGLDAYLVLSGDEHERRAYLPFLTGFTGSYGTALISKRQDEAGDGGNWLITDGRYQIQAAQELDASTWNILEVGARKPSVGEHLAASLGTAPLKIGLNPFSLPLTQWRAMQKHLNDNVKGCSQRHELVPLSEDILDPLWDDEEGQSKPDGPVAVHPLEYAGKKVQDKLTEVRASMEKEGAGALVISALDDIAWLYNLRGEDSEYMPSFRAHAIVTASETHLFIDAAKIASPDVTKHLEDSSITVHPYELFGQTLTSVSENSKCWIDPGRTSWGVYDAITKANGSTAPLEKLSPVALPKAIKNEAEQAGMKAAHKRDAVAMARFLSWLEPAVARGDHVTECSAAEKVDSLRRAQDKNVGLSFPTITGSGPNGAITHYRATPKTDRKLSVDEMLLCDSGGQYLDGTTDVTRTMYFGTPPQDLIDTFTRVLKGHVGLASAVFPHGSTGHQLDCLARAPLWKSGLDYAHGTGHGVGAYLCVHEGPHFISATKRDFDPPLEDGMTTSIEPGFYAEGKFGIRIENIMLVQKHKSEHQMGAGITLLEFEPLTLIPFQRKMINEALLSEEEKDYVNAYHARVRAEISPLLQADDDKAALEWLMHNTEPLA